MGQGPNKTTCIRRFPKGDRKALWRGVGQSPTLQGVVLVGRSFSGLRKNQRGPEGVSQFIPPGDTPSGLPPFPLSIGVIGLSYPPTPRGGVPFRGRSDGVRVRRRSAARRNCCTDAGMKRVSVLCRNRAVSQSKTKDFASFLYTREPFGRAFTAFLLYSKPLFAR